MSDIGRYAASSGTYWIREGAPYVGGYSVGGGVLKLVRVDEYGTVHHLGPARDWDPDAPTAEEAVLDHFATEAEEADRNLDARKEHRREQGVEAVEGAEPQIDSATARFMGY